METFPQNIPLDRKVIQARLKRRKSLLEALKFGMLLRMGVVFLACAGWLLFQSTALGFDALCCLFDIVGSFVLAICIQKADSPPDKTHPLGHGRFEPLAGLVFGLLMIFLGLFNGFFQAKELVLTQGKGGGHFFAYPFIWVIPLISLVLLELGYRWIKRVAKAKKSEALAADAAHYRIDALTSFLALGALVLASLFPHFGPLFDHLGAFAICGFMVVIGAIATRKNVDQLLDRAPDPKDLETVSLAALSVDGVLATEKCHMQMYGPDAHVAIDIEVDPYMNVLSSHELTQKVRRAIQRQIPFVREVIVHVEPYYPDDHVQSSIPKTIEDLGI